MVTLTDDEVRRARATAQRLHRPRHRGSVADLVAGLLAVQAQDIAAAPLALRARAAGLTAAQVAAARADRSVVRAWGPRGTLHLIANDDLDWLLPALAAARGEYSLRRLRQEGVEGEPDHLLRVTERALRDQGPLTKPELAARLAALGVPAQGQGVVHLAALGAFHGRVLLGPDRGGKPTYVHAADWLGRELPAAPDRERALGELVRRYLAAHAPAGPEDLAAWSGLSRRDAYAAWSLVAAELTEVAFQGHPLWRLKARSTVDRHGIALLPAFDEYLLGWRDRALVVDAADTRRVQPGGGIIHPVITVDGRVAGTWRWQRRPQSTVATEPFGPALDSTALRAETEDIARFLS